MDILHRGARTLLVVAAGLVSCFNVLAQVPSQQPTMPRVPARLDRTKWPKPGSSPSSSPPLGTAVGI
jgi:hypothetical protein